MFNQKFFISVSLVFVLLSWNLSFTVQRPTHALKDNIPKGNLSKEDTYKFRTAPFFIVRSRMTWLEAHVACEQYCSELAYLDSTDEAKKVALEIKGLMKHLNYVPDDYLTPAGEKKYEYGLDRRYWIGLNDLDKEGTWMWTGKNRTLDYDFWYPKQPDHNNNPLSNGKYNTIGEHCVVFWYPTFYTKSDTEFPTWNDEPCDNKHYAICDEPLLKIKTTKFGRECIPIKKSI